MRAGKLWPHFPDGTQELLLKACLSEGDAAVSAWTMWRKQAEMDALDIASQRLLPLVCERLKALGVDHPDFARYESVARYVWYENQMQLHVLNTVLDVLEMARVPALVLKGFALGPLYYKSWKLRASSDFDVLVPVSLVDCAEEALRRGGWTFSQAKLVTAAYRTTTHAVKFTNANGVELDLHWHVIRERCDEGADDAYWKNAIPFDLKGREAKTLCDTDHLFHVCIHGTQKNSIPPIRWVADAAMILRSAEIDWPRFLNHATSGKFVRRLSPAIAYLRDVFSLPIPDDVVYRLTAAPAHPVEILEERLCSERLPRIVRSLGTRYVHYRRNAEFPATPANFLQYLQAAWGTPSRTAFVAEGVRRLAPYLGRRTARTETSGRKYAAP